MDFKEKIHQESNKIGYEMGIYKQEILCLSEANDVLNETSDKFPSQLLVQENLFSKLPTPSEDQFEQISIKYN